MPVASGLVGSDDKSGEVDVLESQIGKSQAVGEARA